MSALRSCSCQPPTLPLVLPRRTRPLLALLAWSGALVASLLAGCTSESPRRAAPTVVAPWAAEAVTLAPISTSQPPAARPAAGVVATKQKDPAKGTKATKGDKKVKPLQLSISPCRGARCAITFTFDQAMVRKSPHRLTTTLAAKGKALRLRFDPPQAGVFVWTKPKTLVFRPAAGAMAYGHRIHVRLERAVALSGARLDTKDFKHRVVVPYFEAAGKVASWAVRRGQPRLVSVLNDNRLEVGRGALFALYDQPVSATRLATKVRASHGTSRLPVRVFRPRSIKRVWPHTRFDLRYVLAVQLRHLPKDDEKVLLELPSWPDRGAAVSKTRLLTVRTRLAVTKLDLTSSRGHGDHERAPLAASWNLGLTTRVRGGVLEKHVRLQPKPKSFSVYTWGESARINAQLEPGRTYTLTVDRGLTDVLGNRLAKAARLRVVAQDLPPRLSVPKEPLVLERQRARAALRGLNVGSMSARLRPFGTVQGFIAALAHPARCAKSPGLGSPIATAGAAAPARLNRADEREVDLRGRGTPAATLACLEVSASGSGSEGTGKTLRAAQLVQLTGLGVTAKLHAAGLVAWVTHLKDARPVAGAKVALLDGEGRELAVATSDAQGLARLPGKGLLRRGGVDGRGYLFAQSKDDRALVAVRDDRLSQPWQFGLRGEVKGHAALTAALFTERGVYRPGETVYAKLIVRAAGTLAAPSKRKVKIAIKDPRGRALLDKELTLDSFGGAHVRLALPKDSRLGPYSVQASQGSATLRRSFRVEEYRVPSFAVKLRTAPEPWRTGRPARALLTARYLHGGDLAGRRVSYKVTRQTTAFAPAAYRGYTFAWAEKQPQRLNVVAQGKGRLDGSSALPLTFTASQAPLAGPARFEIEASVEDVDRQVQSTRLSRVVHPTSFYLGLKKPVHAILPPRAQLSVPVAAVDPAGKPRAGVAFTVLLERIDHHTTARLGGRSVQLANRRVPRVVGRCRRQSAGHPVPCTFRMPGAGRYRVRAVARDSKRRAVAAAFEVTVPGKGQIAWPRYDHERVELVTDKPSYRPGDVAKLMIQSPFKRARALLTIERAGLLEQRVVELKKGSPAISVPIDARFAPNVFASVVLLRGRAHDKRDASGFETGAPAFRIGYAQLKVSAPGRRLKTELDVPKVAAPGQRVEVTLRLPRVKSVQGKALAGVRKASATLMVVDEAVLGLTGYRTPKPLAQLLAPRPLGVRTLSSRIDLPQARRARHEAIFPGGGGGYDGDEGERKTETTRLRRDFATTVLFAPDVRIDESGQAKVAFTLPDNLTAFRVMAVVIDEAGRAGSAEARITVRQPLMVRAIVPRFVHADDSLRLEAQVFNGTDGPQTVNVEAVFTGLTIKGKTRRSVRVPAQASRKVAYTVRVAARNGPGSETVTVRFSARSGDHKDAVERTLPRLDPGNTRRIIKSIAVARVGDLTLELPATRVAGSTRVDVLASSSSLTELKPAMDYLLGYPNGCIEQTTSTAYPLVVLEDLLPEIGVKVDPKKLAAYRSAGIKRLLSFQTTSGGLAYWPGSNKPHAFGTAFGMTALLEAKARGYAVPDNALRRVGDYLQGVLAAGPIKQEMPHGGMADGDTRAFIAMTLGRLGRPQASELRALWEQRQKLSGFGLAFLAVAESERTDGDHALLAPILAEARRRAVVDTKEAYYKGKRAGGWSMGSPLRTHAGALWAFAKTAPKNSLAPKLLTGLLKRRRGGLWGNTQENVFGVMGIASIVGKPNGKPPRFTVALDGQSLASEKFAKLGRSSREYRFGPSALKLAAGAHTSKLQIKNDAATPLNVTLRAEYALPLTGKTVAAESRGFSIERRYETPRGRPLDPRKLRLGSLVRVRLRVKTSKKRNYVAITDRLPAGLEPVNAALATTARVRGGKPSKAQLAGLRHLSFQELRDRGAAFFIDDLPASTVELTYLARATTPGRFLRPAVKAEAMYDPDAYGRSTLDHVNVVGR